MKIPKPRKNQGNPECFHVLEFEEPVYEVLHPLSASLLSGETL
jgi:hypothetical protein